MKYEFDVRIDSNKEYIYLGSYGIDARRGLINILNDKEVKDFFDEHEEDEEELIVHITL